MSIPIRQIQMYYNYDKAFVDKVRTIVFYTVDSKGSDSAKPILCVFATPERAFAQVAKQIARREQREVDPADLKNIPLPIASISRGVGVIDQQRYVRYWFKRIGLNKEGTKFLGGQRPLPYTFTYSIDLWTRELQVMDDLTNQAMIWLRANEFWMEVPHPTPIGDINVLVEFDSITDNSVLESETEQRALRRTLVYKVYGWLCYPTEQYGIVEKIITDFYDLDTDDETLESGEFLEGQEITEDEITQTDEEHSLV